jgi:hypothetical protein
MRQIPSLDGPLKASRRLSGRSGARKDAARRVYEGLNLHGSAPDSGLACGFVQPAHLKSPLDRWRTSGTRCGEDFRYML